MNQQKCKFVRFIFVLLVVTSILPACAFNIKAAAPAAISKYELLTAKAAILVTDESRSFSRGGFCLVGAAHEWDFQVGEALSSYSEDYLKTLFSSVEVHHDYLTLNQDSDANYFIFIKMVDLDISQALETDLTLEYVVKNPDGVILFDGEIFGRTRSTDLGWKAFWGGFFVGESVLKQSFTEALEDAFEKLVSRFRQPYIYEQLQDVIRQEE